MVDLPTTEQTEKLPLRAIAAYAARAARRARPKLCGVVDDDIAEEALSLVERLASMKDLHPADEVSALELPSRLWTAAIPCDPSVEGWQQHEAAMSLSSASLLVYWAISAALEQDPDRAAQCATGAARDARATTVCAACAFDRPMATAIAEAAWADYRTLLAAFGEHEDVVLGDPIDLSPESLLGPLMGRQIGQGE